MNNFRTDQLRHSFFLDSVINWNHLPGGIVHAETVESFKSALLKCDNSRSLSLSRSVYTGIRIGPAP